MSRSTATRPNLPDFWGIRGVDPEKVFERVWLEDLVRQSIGRVRERCVRSGKETRFRLYEAFTLGPAAEPPSYAELAARFGVALGEVEKSLYLVREAIRREMRAAVVQSAGSTGTENEWRRILGE